MNNDAYHEIPKGAIAISYLRRSDAVKSLPVYMRVYEHDGQLLRAVDGESVSKIIIERNYTEIARMQV